MGLEATRSRMLEGIGCASLVDVAGILVDALAAVFAERAHDHAREQAHVQPVSTKPQGEALESVHPSHMWDGDRCVACTCRKDALYLSTKPCDHIGPDGVPAPSVGRIVHYFGKLKDKVPFTPTREADADLAYDYFHELDEGPFAALVIDVTALDAVTLEVTGRTGRKYIRAHVRFDEKMSLGSWCWAVRTLEAARRGVLPETPHV